MLRSGILLVQPVVNGSELVCLNFDRLLLVHGSIKCIVLFLDGSKKIGRLFASQSWQKPGSAVEEWEPYSQ